MPEQGSNSSQQYMLSKRSPTSKSVQKLTHMEVCSYHLYQILITNVCDDENKKKKTNFLPSFNFSCIS